MHSNYLSSLVGARLLAASSYHVSTIAYYLDLPPLSSYVMYGLPLLGTVHSTPHPFPTHLGAFTVMASHSDLALTVLVLDYLTRGDEL